MSRNTRIAVAAFGIVIIAISIYFARLPRTQTTPSTNTSETPIARFTDVTATAGIQFRHFNGADGMKLLPETMGSGVAVLDYDHDGHPDLFFVNCCPWPGRP